jgi:hypothetical protein
MERAFSAERRSAWRSTRISGLTRAIPSPALSTLVRPVLAVASMIRRYRLPRSTPSSSPKTCRCVSPPAPHPQDRDRAALILEKIPDRFPCLELIGADGAYQARQVDAAIADHP